MAQSDYLYKCLTCGNKARVNEKDLEISLASNITSPDGDSVPFYEANYYCPRCHQPMVVCQWEEYIEKTVDSKDTNWSFEKLDGEAKCEYKIVKGE